MSDFLVRLRHAEIQRLGDKGGPATAVVRVHAEQIRVAAIGRAPRSPRGSHGRSSGYLAGHIVTEEGQDVRSFYVAVVTTARTPKGFPYGSLMELDFPYLLPGARRANRVLRKTGTVARVRLRTRRKAPKRAHI